jgi:hypothetical protein
LPKPGIFKIPQATSVFFHKEIPQLLTKEWWLPEMKITGTAGTEFREMYTQMFTGAMTGITAITTIMTGMTATMEMCMAAGQGLCLEPVIA